MSGKGDKRRPGDGEAYRSNYDKIFGVADTTPVECPRCGEIALTPPTKAGLIWECTYCKHEEQL
jgi:ribosomal protein L37AE/L43A